MSEKTVTVPPKLSELVREINSGMKRKRHVDIMENQVRLGLLKQAQATYGLTLEDLAEVTDYTTHSVSAWFAHPGAERHRSVPSQAIMTLCFKIGNGLLNPKG